jgi:hypothetical protein
VAPAQNSQGAPPARQRPHRRPPAQRSATERPAAQNAAASGTGTAGTGPTGGRKAGAAGPAAGGRKSKFHQSGPPPKPTPKPKPVVPLTKAMQEGKAPLRTFGDLKQFLAMKQETTPDEDESTGT